MISTSSQKRQKSAMDVEYRQRECEPMDSAALREKLKDKKRIVIKVGTSSLTHQETGSTDLITLEKLVRELTDLHNRGKEVILVSSGAIAVGRKTIGMKERPTKLSIKQACASIGQARLMMIYQKLFMEYNPIIPKSYNGYMIAGDAPWIDSPLIEKYPTVHYKVMSFEDVKMRADASEDDETNGTIICDTQEQLEGALKKKCEEQYAAGVDNLRLTICRGAHLKSQDPRRKTSPVHSSKILNAPE